MWFPLALITAVFAATADALTKKALVHDDVRSASLARAGATALCLAPFFFLAAPPTDPRAFWTAVAWALPFEVAAAFAYQAALKSSPLSLAAPYLAFTPAFLVVVAPAILGERPSRLGLAGIALIVTGALLLQATRRSTPFSVVAALFRERGCRLMLLVALLFSVTSAFVKKGLVASSGFYFGPVYFLLLAVCVLAFQRHPLQALRRPPRRPLLWMAIGACETLALLLQFQAMQMTAVAYVISVKRLSLIFAVVYGWRMFSEAHIASRMAGAALMVAGAVLTAFA